MDVETEIAQMQIVHDKIEAIMQSQNYLDVIAAYESITSFHVKQQISNLFTVVGNLPTFLEFESLRLVATLNPPVQPTPVPGL